MVLRKDGGRHCVPEPARGGERIGKQDAQFGLLLHRDGIQ